MKYLAESAVIYPLGRHKSDATKDMWLNWLDKPKATKPRRRR